MILAIIYRDLKLAFSSLGQFFNAIIFFFVSISIFAISSANLPVFDQLDYQICIIWFCLIFVNIIGISSFLKEDFVDGSLEQILVNNRNLELVIISKILANWLIFSLPLITFLPLAAIILKIDVILWQKLVLMAILVTLIINLIGCFCASLTLSCNKNESLITILILPLIIPVIIFANSAFTNVNGFSNAVIFLGLIFAFLAPLLIILTSLAVKIAIFD